MTAELIDNSQEKEMEALQHVAEALQARVNLWDAIQKEIEMSVEMA